MNETERERLTTLRRLQCVQIAEIALQMPDNLNDDSIRSLMAAQNALARLEITTLALLADAGFSWQRMAAVMHVSRQTLHYRVSKKIAAAVESWTRGGNSGINLNSQLQDVIDRLGRYAGIR